MKNNTFKRVMAGTLAVLTVASPMAANVGGFLTGGSAIVANAVDAKIDATEKSMYSAINSSDGAYKWAVGDYFEEKAVLTKATTDKTKFTLRVPMTEFANTETKFDETATTGNGGGNPDDSSSVSTVDDVMRIDNVEKVEYTPTLADSTVIKELKITYSFTIQGTDTTALATRTFRVKNKETPESTEPGDATKYFISVASVDVNVSENNNSTTVTLGREDVKETYVFQFKDARQYIESISYTYGGAQTTISGSQVTSNTLGIEVDSKTPMTIVTTALLQNKGHNYFANYTPTYANGKYTYVINAVRDYQDVGNDVSAYTAVTTVAKYYTIDNGTSAEDKHNVYIQRKTDSEPVLCVDKDLSDTVDPKIQDIIQAGSTVTITADSPFFIEKGQITGQNEDGTFQTADVKGVYKDGKFTATFVASDADADTIYLSAMPTNLDYSGMDTNKMTATSKGEEEGIVVNAEVASVTAYVKTPVYVNNDPTKGFMKGKDQFTGETGDLYNYTEIARNGNTTYSKDLNADVVLKFALDNNMLVKDTDGKSYFVEITDANKKVVANYTYKPDAVEKKFDANVLVENGPKLINGDANGFSVSTKNAGTYNITVSVWGAGDNKVRNLNYSYTVNPATMTADDLTPIAFYTGDAVNNSDLDANKAAFVERYEELVTAKQEYYKDPKGIYTYTINRYNGETLEGTHSDLTKVDPDTYTSANISELPFGENSYEVPGHSTKNDAKNGGIFKDSDDHYFVLAYSNFDQRYHLWGVNSFTGGTYYIGGDLTHDSNSKAELVTITNADRVAEAQDEYDTFLDNANVITNITKNDDGVWEVPVNADKLKEAKTATFYAVVDPELAVKALRVNGDEKTSIINGTPGSATLQVMDTNYGGSETAPKNFEFKWKLVDEVVEDGIYFEVANSTDNNKRVAHSTADAAEFASVVKNALRSTNGIDVSNATFKYTLTKQAGGMIDIDSMTMGLPTDAALERINTTIYVYATVGSLETAEPLEVSLQAEATKTKVNAVLNKLTYTYGEVISPEDLFFVEQGKDTKIDALTTTDNTRLHISWREADFTTLNDGSKVYNKDSGVYTFNNKQITNKGEGLVPKVLAPGIYQITIDNCTNLSDELYQFEPSSVAQEDIPKTFIIEVKKKTVESYMVDEVQLKLTNGEARVNNNTFRGSDVPGGLLGGAMTFSIVGKKTSATTPGRYTVTVEPSGNTANYYEGEVDVTWCATTTDEQALRDKYELQFNDENSNIYKDKNGVQIHVDAYIRDIVNNASLTTKDLQGDTAKIKVAKYGFLYEKAGKLAEYTADDIDIVAQKMRLGQGILTTNATMKDTSGNPLLARTGINSVVKSIDDYIWLRPYLVTEDGVTIYGEPRRYDFTTVAQKAIAPEIGRAELVQKDGSIYYYAYASKHTKNDEEKIDGIDRTAIPDAFGVVIDRGDNYAPVNFPFEANNIDTLSNALADIKAETTGTDHDAFDLTLGKFSDAMESMSTEYTKNATNSINNYQSIVQLKTIDESFNKMIAIAKRSMLEGNANITSAMITAAQNAYINTGIQAIAAEYLDVADKLTLDTCDVKSKAMSNNEYYNQDECGTLIRITDSLSNVYVRTYVDFGEGLVVYSAPQCIESASAQLSRANGLQLSVAANKNNKVDQLSVAQSGDLYQMVAQRNLAPSTVTLKAKAEDLHAKTGKIQSFEAIQYVTAGKTDEAKANMATEYGLVIDKTGEVTMKGNTKQLVLGEGFIDLKSSKPNADTLSGDDWKGNSYADNGKVDFGAVTTVANASVSARAYMVFKGVTIYSKPVTSGLTTANVKLYTGDMIVDKGTTN